MPTEIAPGLHVETVGDILERTQPMPAVAKREAAPSDIASYEGGLISAIERAARDPNTDVDKMERLFALQERLLARTAEQEYADAKALAQAEMPQIKRTGNNEQTRSSYAELDLIAAKVDPVMAKHGFSLSYGTAESHLEGHYRVTARLRHRGGFFEDFQADVPSDTVGMKGNQNKTPTHGFGSTMSYGRRYLKLLIWDIATTDDDGQAASTGSLIGFNELELLKARCSQVGGNEARFATVLGVPSLAHLPAARLSEALAKLDAKETADAVKRLGQ